MSDSIFVRLAGDECEMILEHSESLVLQMSSDCRRRL